MHAAFFCPKQEKYGNGFPAMSLRRRQKSAARNKKGALPAKGNAPVEVVVFSPEGSISR